MLMTLVNVFIKILFSLNMFTVYFLAFGLTQLLLFQHVIGIWFVLTSVVLLLSLSIVLKKLSQCHKWYHKISLPKGTTVHLWSNKTMIFSVIVNVMLILISTIFDVTSGIITLLLLTITFTIAELYYLNPVLIFFGYNVYKVTGSVGTKTYWLIGKMSIDYPYYNNKPIELISDKNVIKFSNKVIIG